MDIKFLKILIKLVRSWILSIVASSMGKFVNPSFLGTSKTRSDFQSSRNFFEGETRPGQCGSPLGSHNIENLVKAAAGKAEKRWHPKTDQRTHAWTNRIILKQSSQWKLKRATTYHENFDQQISFPRSSLFIFCLLKKKKNDFFRHKAKKNLKIKFSIRIQLIVLK